MPRFPSVLMASFALALVAAAPPAGAQGSPIKPSEAQPAPSTKGDKSGVVLIEHAGRVLGLGMILNGDGRVLTALSRVSAASQGQLFVRYADGALVLVRIGHADKDRDLALLVPKLLRSRKGVQASRSGTPSPGVKLVGFSNAPNRVVLELQHSVKRSFQSAGRRVIEVTPTPKALDLGGPLLDVHGQAVAITVSGCLGPPAPQAGASSGARTEGSAPAKPVTPAPPSPCDADPVGIPVTELRAFLRELPSAAALMPAWLGIEGVSADTGHVRGIRIGRIEPKSPAAALGLKANTETTPGDVLVAVAGKPVPTPDALQAELTIRAPGSRVELLIFGDDGFKVVPVRLAERPAAPAP